MIKYIISHSVISFDALQSYIDGLSDIPTSASEEIKEYAFYFQHFPKLFSYSLYLVSVHYFL